MRVLGVSVVAAVCMHVGLRACMFVRYLRDCVALIMWAGRHLSSTSLSGTLPESISHMTGLREL
eukprot:COSAG02_NODE_3404_length_6797_cov_54.443267_2_plen_64_part_00